MIDDFISHIYMVLSLHCLSVSLVLATIDLMRILFMARFSVTVFMLLFSLVRAYDTDLSLDYYSELCPLAEDIVRQNVEAAVYRDPTLAAALLRLHFHDCFVLV